jgi:hypothetical protein
MLQNAQAATKGGKRTFAALRTKDCNADLVSFRCGCANGRFKQRSKNGRFGRFVELKYE